MLRAGIVDAVIAGASDTLCGVTSQGFDALQAIARGVTNPMSKNRDGLTLGEGAALFLVTREEGGFQLLGAGEAMDAHHMSAPHPEGVGAASAMRAALSDAGLEASAIQYLNLHGTGTPHNDAMESLAVRDVFPVPPACSSTKPLTGHTLAAAGAIEAGLCWLMLDRAGDGDLAVPAHAFDGELDPELPQLALAGPEARVDAGPLMTCSFGFGGSNCALILGGDA